MNFYRKSYASFNFSMKGYKEDDAIQKAFRDLQERYDTCYFNDHVPSVPWYPRSFDDLNESDILILVG